MSHAFPHRDARARRGGTMLEVMLSIILTVSAFGLAIPFFRMQTRSVGVDAGRSDAQQTARHAQNMLDRELRNLGISVQRANQAFGVTRDQPKIVQADTFAI